MFKKVLIANRGEVACRIARACRGLGVQSVAIYSEADRESLHVRMADEAICVGPPSNAESYLNMPNVLMAAVVTGSEAVHPGYGYFSEQEQFADALQMIGVRFIGPGPDAIALMGDKAAARAAAASAGCPMVPGSEGVVQNDDEAMRVADRLGYPVIIKASAGGGGRGIRKADSQEDLPIQFRIARQEAEAGFGSGDLYIEKFIENSRHVEVQIIADTFGNCVSLGERECSIQNLRHQKMVEEAPFALLSEESRREMGDAAVRLAKSAGYVNAGTVEFLMDEDGQFYFIEMNTRLQVEHPVTEEVTGIDIVQTMLRVAAGEELPFSQDDVRLEGHAIEARITAQDPDRQFAPSCGTITRWDPPEAPHVRLDTHVFPGFEVTPYYDPLIAKLIVKGKDRAEAVDRLRSALDEFHVEGPQTTLPFLRRLVRDDRFVAGRLNTGFVPSFLSEARSDDGA
ncbi:MAG: acetyl-CoA carboxylase biotin carboxylase subunit [Armatimonadetes bacterium]|nr:acetyl-CoA carboxylase biotin carboxylase subunit [Armatimonadota bacterium]